MNRKICSLLIAFIISFGSFSIYAQTTNEQILQAEDYKNSANAVETTSNSVTYMTVSDIDTANKTTGYLAYDINIETSGKYSVNIRASGTNDGYVNISVDGIPLSDMNIRKTGTNTKFDNNIAICDFSQGTHVLKLASTIGPVNIDYIELKYLDNATDATCESFLQRINAAETSDELENVLIEYKEILNIDLSDIKSGIFYPDPIFEEMTSHKYDDVNEVFAKLYSIARQYKATPDIQMRNGRNYLSVLESGDLTMVVRTERITKPCMVIGAIYEDRKLYKINGSEFTNETSLQIPFDGVEIDPLKSYSFKVFYMDNKIAPFNPYESVFRQIFVSNEGKDTDDGTKEAPVKTLRKAKEIISEISDNMTGNIEVNIEPGEYYLSETERFTAEHSGKNGYNIIIQAADENNPPVLHGGQKITGWTEGENGIYSAPYDGEEKVRNLYVDGFATVRARSDKIFRCEDFYDDESTSYEKDGYSVYKTRVPNNFARPQDLEMVWELYWTCQRVPVSELSFDGEYAIFKSDAKKAINYNSGTEKININKNKYFYLENAMELLDEPGEFYHNPEEKRIYYYPFENEKLENTYIASTERLFEVGANGSEKTENIIFHNLDIRYGAWNEVSSLGLCGIQADSIADFSENSTSSTKMMHSQFLVNNASEIDITNCTFSCLGSNAIHLKDDVTASKIEGNTIKDISGGAISIGSFEHTPTVGKMCIDIDIKNNLIRRTSQEYRQTAAISVYYENSIKICHNDIADIPYTGITVGWGWGYDCYNAGNVSVCHNKIADVMNCLEDGSHIYTLGNFKDSAIFKNYTSDSKYVIEGIYNDSGSKYWKIFNNVLYVNSPDSYWWYQGLYNTSDLHAFSNYVTNGTIAKNGENNVDEDTIVINENDLPMEAEEIMSSAGLYEGNSLNAELPTYRTSVVKDSPYVPYSSVCARRASDYDRCYDPITEVVLVPKEEYVSFGRQEWMEYDVDIEKAGTYSLTIYASNGWPEDDVNTDEKVNQPISVSVDGVEQLSYTVPRTDDWATENWDGHIEFKLGNIQLKEGKNTIRFKNESKYYYGIHFAYFIIE